MDIQKVAIDSVKLWDKNPRNIRPDDYERMKRQIQKLGMYKPLVACRDNGEFIVLGGNMRLKALKEMGIKEVDLSIVDAPTEKERIEFALSDNDQAGFYDTDLLSELVMPHVDEIPLNDFKIELSDAVTVQAIVDEFTDLFVPEGDEEASEESKGEEGDKPVEEPFADKEKEITSIKYNELEGLELEEDMVYCPLQADRFDVARGRCPNGCLYCYAINSPSGKMNMPLRHVKREEIRRMVLKARDRSRLVTTGLCMDPMSDGVEEPLIHLIQNIISKDMQLFIMTKDPKKLFTLLTKELKSGFKSHVMAKVSFSHPNPTLARKLEPRAPSYESRFEGMRLLKSVGVTSIGRFQPFFCGHTDGYSGLLKDMETSIITIEPLRANQAGAKYFQQALLAIGDDLASYFRKWGRPSAPTFGNMHWYDYDARLLRGEFQNIRKQVKEAGKDFGLCGALGYQSADLNDHAICCQIPGLKVIHDPLALSCLIHTGEYKKLRIPFIRQEADLKKRLLLMDRVAWLNDPNNPVFIEESEGFSEDNKG